MTEKDLFTGANRRRSERLYLALPVRVSATDPKGRDFTEDCISVDVSRHGARIRLKNALTVDDVIHIINLKNNKGAAFRVVARVSEPQPDVDYTDWGVEILNVDEQIWGIELKDNPAEDIATSAVMQCNSCTVVASFLLTHKELGSTGSAAYLTRRCPRCLKETLWRFVSSDRKVSPVDTAAQPIEKGLEAERKKRLERRREERLSVEVPIRIRTPEGQQEVSKTVNLSRTGARFYSSQEYPVGSILYVAAPYMEGEEPLEMVASVLHVEKEEGSAEKIFGTKLYDIAFGSAGRGKKP